MRTNIDLAIAEVIEREQDLSIPNVFSAYFQHILPSYKLPDDISVADRETFVRAALVSFERAMDKYPMPSKPTKTKTKTSSVKPSSTTVDRPRNIKIECAGRVGSKLYSDEVAQLRWDYYQQAMLRATELEEPGCSCLSCCSLVAMREQAAMLMSESEDGFEPEVPVRKRRVRKTKKRAAKTTVQAPSARVAPFDPYAPSTSAAVAL